jgi:glutamate carboxypeptidase
MSFKDGTVDVTAVLADIERLAAIESPTASPEGVNRVLDAVAAMFAGTGAVLSREKIDPRFGEMLRVRCNPGSGGPGILVLSHIDTVHPIGTLAQLLPIRRDGDRLYGPGVFDMKGGAVLGIAGFLRMRAQGLASRLPVTFLFTPDEENGSVGSRKFIEAAAKDAKYVLVTEPKRNGGRVVTSRKGTGRYVIEARGRPSHAGAKHEEGRSAIREIAHTILEIEGWTDYERGITTNVGMVTGGTGVNVIPEHARINADVRVVDPQSAIEMDRRYRALKPHTPDVALTVSGGMSRPPWSSDAATELIFKKAQAIAAEMGVKLETGARTGGGSDGNFSAAMGVPTLDGLGVDGEGAHTLDEHMLISSVEPGVRLFQGLFEKLD